MKLSVHLIKKSMAEKSIQYYVCHTSKKAKVYVAKFSAGKYSADVKDAQVHSDSNYEQTLKSARLAFEKRFLTDSSFRNLNIWKGVTDVSQIQTKIEVIKTPALVAA